MKAEVDVTDAVSSLWLMLDGLVLTLPKELERPLVFALVLRLDDGDGVQAALRIDEAGVCQLVSPDEFTVFDGLLDAPAELVIEVFAGDRDFGWIPPVGKLQGSMASQSALVYAIEGCAARCRSRK